MQKQAMGTKTQSSVRATRSKSFGENLLLKSRLMKEPQLVGSREQSSQKGSSPAQRLLQLHTPMSSTCKSDFPKNNLVGNSTTKSSVKNSSHYLSKQIKLEFQCIFSNDHSWKLFRRIAWPARKQHPACPKDSRVTARTTNSGFSPNTCRSPGVATHAK